jgi:hypothetical protein
LIKDQINEIASAENLVGLERAVFTVGGDHGGGKFRMTFKILLVFSSKKSISRLYQIASVEHSKDETEILKTTVLEPVGEGLRKIVSGKCFIVQKLSEGMLSASFNVLNDPNDTPVICNISSSLVVAGDLKFYFQILGRENMSGSWCCWCTTHPSTWDKLCTSHHCDKQEDTWTISKLKDCKHRIEAGQLKEAREKKGIVHHPVWDFIEPDHFMFPQLHVEIGLVNNVLENYYDFVEDQVEAAMPEQKVARNNVIIATRSLERAKERLLNGRMFWKQSIAIV